MNTITTAATTYAPPSTSVVHNAQVSLTSRPPASVVHLVQYDVTIPIVAVSLVANGQPYTVPDGAAVNVRMKKPDGTYVYNPVLGVSENAQTAYIAITLQMTAAYGKASPVVEIVVDGNVAATGFFVLDIDENPVPESAIESTDEYQTIQQLAAEVNQAAQIVTDNLPGIQYIQQNADTITAVAQNSENITAVGGSIGNVNSVAQNLTPIQTAATNISAIQAAPTAASNAAASATLAESWAVGGTGTRSGEDTNNAQYWAGQAQSVAQGQLGWFATEQALESAHPTGQNGQWAIVGSTDTIWTWDSDTGAWVNTGSQMDLSGYYTKEQSDERYATAAQGKKADTAVQSVNGVSASAGAVTIPIGAKWTLLWENPNPNVAFSAQTVSLSLSEYEAVMVVSLNYISIGGAFCVSPTMSFVDAGGFILSSYYTIRSRQFFVYATRIDFGSAHESSTLGQQGAVNDKLCIPYKIYGLKF